MLPLNLVITVSAPGTVSIKFSDFLLYGIERGQLAQRSCNVLKFGPVQEFFLPLMRQLVNEAFSGREDLVSDKFTLISYGGEYLRFLVQILKCAEVLGHGGAIIILRENEETSINDHLSIKYPISCGNLWDDLVQYTKSIFDYIESSKLIFGKPNVEKASLDRWRAASREREKLSQQLIDRSRFLARLTQVDGALVMTERLKVLGFGAIIKDLSEFQPTFRFCQDELCRQFDERKRAVYGARHRSAIEICQRVDCIAFVLSQDGAVKALRRVGDQVLLWPSVLLGPSAWFITAEDMIPQLREQYLNRAL